MPPARRLLFKASTAPPAKGGSGVRKGGLCSPPPAAALVAVCPGEPEFPWSGGREAISRSSRMPITVADDGAAPAAWSSPGWQIVRPAPGSVRSPGVRAGRGLSPGRKGDPPTPGSGRVGARCLNLALQGQAPRPSNSCSAAEGEAGGCSARAESDPQPLQGSPVSVSLGQRQLCDPRPRRSPCLCPRALLRALMAPRFSPGRPQPPLLQAGSN